MPIKYKSLIPLLEGESFDYSNSINFMDDADVNDRVDYFKVSVKNYDPEGESPSINDNVQRAKSCYQLRTSGLLVKDDVGFNTTSAFLVQPSTSSLLIPGRYEIRVMLPKKSSSQFELMLYGRYGGVRDTCSITIDTPVVGEGNIYNNLGIACMNRISGTGRASQKCTISKDLNDGNFHVIGFDWYCSDTHKCVRFFIDNTEIATLTENVPDVPMRIYLGSQPHSGLSNVKNNFDYDYCEVDFIRFTAFANQNINTSGTITADNVYEDITNTVSTNIDIPRILKVKKDGVTNVASKVTKADSEIIVRNFNSGSNKYLIDTNGNRDAYSYGTFTTIANNKLTIPGVVHTTVNNIEGDYPVITSARARLNKIAGNSIVWNQLCPNFLDKRYTDNVTTGMWAGDGGSMTRTKEADGTQVLTYMSKDPTGGTFRMRPYWENGNNNVGYMHNLPQRYHKVLFKWDARAEGTDAEGWDWGDWHLVIDTVSWRDNFTLKNTMVPNKWTTFEYIQEMKNSYMNCMFVNPSYSWKSGVTGKKIGYSLRRVMVFDLTLMFGTGNEPTIEEFNRMFPDVYYSWTAVKGELKSTQIQSIKSYSADGTELDSINLPSEVLNKDYISSSLNSQYHNGFQVTNRLKLNEYTYDGADFLGIEEFIKVKSVDLGTYTWSKETNNYYDFYDSGLNSAALNSDMGYSKYSCILCPVLSSTSPSNLANNTTTTNHNKAISFSDNNGGLYAYDSQYADAAAFKTGMTGVKAYIGMSTATQSNNDVTNYLRFDDISLKVEKDGYIEVAYTGVQPSVSFDFPVQLYTLYTASYTGCDISCIDAQVPNVQYTTPIYLDTITAGKTIKWSQLINVATKTSTVNGVTFSGNNSEGRVSVRGTATADISYTFTTGGVTYSFLPTDMLYMRGCPSGGSESTYSIYWGNIGMRDTGDGQYYKLNHYGGWSDRIGIWFNPSIQIKSGTTIRATFYPQLYRVSDMYGLGAEPATAAAFRKDYVLKSYPFGDADIRSTIVTGIKIKAGYQNLFTTSDFPATQTMNGITFTNNGNGTVTVNGTATADAAYPIANRYYLPSVNQGLAMFWWFLQGCPAGGSTSTYYMSFDWGAINDIGGGNINRNSFDNKNGLNIKTSIRIKSGTTCNNLVFKPQLVSLTDCYGTGNEPKEPAKFREDFPDITKIPYPDTTISFDEQTLYGLKKTKDMLQIVQEDSGYKLQFVPNVSKVDMGNFTWTKKNTEDSTTSPKSYFWQSSQYSNRFGSTDMYWTNPDFLSKNYTPKASVYITLATGQSSLAYNKTVSARGGWGYLVIRDTTYDTVEDFTAAIKGQYLWFANQNPIPKTIAHFTPSQVSAMFSKGYCIEVLGNDNNRIITRPVVTLKVPSTPTEEAQTLELDTIEVGETAVVSEETSTGNFDEVNESSEEEQDTSIYNSLISLTD